MNWVLLGLSVLPKLVGLYEKLFPAEGQGGVKKSAVKETFHTIAQITGAVSTGGQVETWEKVDAIIDPIIDATVSAANTFGWGGVEDDSAKWGL